MKPRLQTSLGQQLVLTPQLRQAIHLLQLSALELEAELAAAVESNPLLDWAEPEPTARRRGRARRPWRRPRDRHRRRHEPPPWSGDGEPWQQRVSSSDGDEDDGDAAERVAEAESLRDHLLWQLHLTHLSPRDRRIGAGI